MPERRLRVDIACARFPRARRIDLLAQDARRGAEAEAGRPDKGGYRQIMEQVCVYPFL